MKSTVFSILFSLSVSNAVTWDIHHPCTGKIHRSGRGIVSSPFPSVGHFTILELKKNRIEFVGSQGHVQSILGTPTGELAIEVKDSRNMWAYGWCYEVNGVEPGVMPMQFPIKSQGDHIRWFYAFTEMRNGQWLTMCRPAWERPFKKYCEKL
ncbi:MAG: hypothetical protein ACK5V3_10050 [Bdellovibrionales bacterium]